MYTYSSVYMVEKLIQAEVNDRLHEAENGRLVALARQTARDAKKASERQGLLLLHPLASWLVQVLRG